MTKSTIALEARNTAPQTPLAELREALDGIETRLGRMGISSSEDTAEIPALFDLANAIQTQLAPSEAELAIVKSRLNSLAAQYRSKGRKFLKTVGGADKLVEMREARQPASDAWWWYLDQYLEEQRREAWRTTRRSLLIAGSIFAVVVAIYMIFLRPDKATRDRLAYSTNADQLMRSGDLPGALEQIELALVAAPEDSELWATKGAIQEALGQTTAASESFETSLRYAASLQEFLAVRTQGYLAAGLVDAALASAEELVALEPQSAAAYLQLASAQVNAGLIYEAYLSYETAAARAGEADQPELEGIARVQMAYLTMQLTGPQVSTPTP